MVPIQTFNSPLEKSYDLLFCIHLKACVGLTRRLLTSIYFSTGAARQRVVMKTIILFFADYGSKTWWTDRGKALPLACWNAAGVRGRKLELERFLNQQGVDICLLSETFLKPGKAFRLANYICHSTESLTARGGTTITDRRSILRYPVPVPGLTHLEANVIQVKIGKNTCGLPFAFPPTDRSGPDRLFGGGCRACWPATSKPNMWIGTGAWTRDGGTHTWECRREIFSELWTGHTNHQPVNPSAIPDVLDTVITRKLPSPVYLTSWSALSSDHLPVLNDNVVAHPFIIHRIALIAGALTGPTSKLAWNIKIRSIQNCITGWQLTHALRTSPVPFWRPWQHLLTSVSRVTTHCLRYWLAFRIR